MPSCFEHMRLVRPDKRLLTDRGVEFFPLYVDLKGESGIRSYRRPNGEAEPLRSRRLSSMDAKVVVATGRGEIREPLNV